MPGGLAARPTPRCPVRSHLTGLGPRAPPPLRPPARGARTARCTHRGTSVPATRGAIRGWPPRDPVGKPQRWPGAPPGRAGPAPALCQWRTWQGEFCGIPSRPTPMSGTQPRGPGHPPVLSGGPGGVRCRGLRTGRHIDTFPSSDCTREGLTFAMPSLNFVGRRGLTSTPPSQLGVLPGDIVRPSEIAPPGHHPPANSQELLPDPEDPACLDFAGVAGAAAVGFFRFRL